MGGVKIENKINNIKIIALLSIFVLFCGVISISEPVSAAKVKEKAFKVDQGSKYYYDKEAGAPGKMSWKTYLYYPSQKRKVFKNFYVKRNGKYVLEEKTNYTISRVSKNKMKIIYYYEDLDGNPCSEVMYKKTKLNTRMYYWLVFRKQMMKDPCAPY